MKKLLIALVAAVTVGLMGVIGYLAATEFIKTDEKKDVPNESSAQSEEKTEEQKIKEQEAQAAKIEVNKMKPVKSVADIMHETNYAYSKNRDTVGWINIPDTTISNSVLQSFDNAYYLRRDEERKDHIYGCYFADYTCNFGTRDQLSPNTVIYGHSDLKDNPDGPRFSQLFKFTNEKFARRHRKVSFSTREEVMDWQIFAVYYTDFSVDFARADYDGADLVEYANQAKARSLYNYNVDISPDDKILTLVTCTVKYGAQEKDQRLIVAAKLMPEGWEQDTSIPLETNPNPIQPVFE